MLKVVGICLLVVVIAVIGGSLMFFRPPESLADLRASYDACVAEEPDLDDPVSVVVYLGLDTPDDKAIEVVTLLEDAAGAKSVSYIDKQTTWETFLEFYNDDPNVLKLVTAEDLPASIEADFETRMQADAIQVKLEGHIAIGSWTFDTRQSCRQPKNELDAICAKEEVGPIHVWMETTISPDQVDAAWSFFDSSPDVESFRFIDRVETQREFASAYANQPEVLESADLTSLPASFQVTLTPEASPDVRQSAIGQISQVPGVDRVTSIPYADPEVAALC